MCFATAALIAGGIGAATTAVGDVEGGIAQGNAAHYQAQVAKNNATIENQNAEYAAEAGGAQGQMVGQRAAATGGRIKAGQAANGINVNTGSAEAVQEGARQAGQLDVLTTENNALLEAYGYKTQSKNFEAQAGLDEAEADQAPIAGDLAAGGSLLSNASSLGYRWSQMQGQ